MTTPSARTARLANALDTLARLYRIRKLFGRSVAWLFPRCHRLSTAYLDALEADRHLPL